MAQSTLTYNIKAFDPASADPATLGLNQYLVAHANDSPKWYEIGAAKWRALQEQGKTSWPLPKRLERAKDIFLPSREAGRKIKCRLLEPQDGTSKGVFMHIHGGGHVLLHADYQDEWLAMVADTTSLTVISVEYRLAPEHPFPAGPEDCYDVATHLVDNSLSAHSGPLKFIGGESAGATLSAQTVLHLIDNRPKFTLLGTVLVFGVFDFSLLPSARTWTNPLIIDTIGIQNFYSNYLPNHTYDERRVKEISPIYHPVFQYPGSKKADAEESERGKLPPALFLTGTQDLVVDDMVLMSFKWSVAGAEAKVEFIAGAPHAFTTMPPEQFGMVGEGRSAILGFLNNKMER